jgi:hypothetical protein
MKYYGKITDDKDLVTKEYVDSAISGISIPAQINKVYTAKCTTAAGTTAKLATLDDSEGFSLVAGVRVAVTFTYGNSATTPTLNVNSSGAKTIAIPNSVSGFTTGNGTTYNTWGAYETLVFTYNGTYWIHEPSGRLGYLAYNGVANAVTKSSTSTVATSNVKMGVDSSGPYIEYN